MTYWQEAQAWETSWWGDCSNTYGEEEKQLVYADRLGLKMHHNGKSPYNIDLEGQSVVDIGGGPASLLLKTVNAGGRLVVDPLTMPDWVFARYAAADIQVLSQGGEGFVSVVSFDEAWIYNCLQHTDDPRTVVRNALANAGIVRVFEWIDTVQNVGHPHILTAAKLDKWLGGEGRIEELTGQAGCFGKCYYGVFTGGHER